MSNLTIADAPALIEDFRDDLMPIVKENGQSFDRLKTTFLIAVQQEPDILKCTPDSIRREISKCAADGLVPDAKEAVLLSYYDTKEKVYVANYQPMVHGVIKRLRELGGVFQIVCNLVYENDTYEENEADPDSLVHKSPGFGKPRGEIVGGYVIFRDDQKRVMHFEKMSKADFDRVRQASKSPNSPAWTKWMEEMCRKAVLRRGSKYLSTNNDKIRALIERTDAMFDMNQPRQVERSNPFGGTVIAQEKTPALEHQTTESVTVDTKAQEKQRVDASSKPKQEPVDHKAKAQKQLKSEEKSKAELPEEFPDIPDVDVAPEDREKMQECAEKILRIALEPDLDPADRRGVLKSIVPDWKEKIPQSLHPLLQACVNASDVAIRRDAKGEAWAGDHAQFVHKVKSLLGVEKLNIGKYP